MAVWNCRTERRRRFEWETRSGGHGWPKVVPRRAFQPTARKIKGQISRIKIAESRRAATTSLILRPWRGKATFSTLSFALCNVWQTLRNYPSAIIILCFFVGYPLTASCFLMKSGSISTPKPGPVGTLIFPSTTVRGDVLHSNFTFVFNPLNS